MCVAVMGGWEAWQQSGCKIIWDVLNPKLGKPEQQKKQPGFSPAAFRRAKNLNLSVVPFFLKPSWVGSRAKVAAQTGSG